MDELEAELVGRRIAVALVNDNRIWAYAIIDEALGRKEDDIREMTVGQKLDLPLARVLEVRLANTLEKELGLITVGQLLNTTKEELLEAANFGEHSLRKVMDALKGLGFEAKEKVK